MLKINRIRHSQILLILRKVTYIYSVETHSEEVPKERFSVTLADAAAIAELHRRMAAADRRREPLASEILTAALLNRPTQTDTVADAITRIENKLGTVLNRLPAPPPKVPASPTPAVSPAPKVASTPTLVDRAVDWSATEAGVWAFAVSWAGLAALVTPAVHAFIAP